MTTERGVSPLLKFNEATVVLSGVRALDGITLTIGAGEHAAVLGPNGSGKSTLIKNITRELHPLARDNGAPVRVMGKDIWDIFQLRKSMGIVSSDFQQISSREMSGREAVLSGFFGSVGLYPHFEVTADMERRTTDILEFLEIGHLAEKLTTRMSTGETRRVLIARALVHDPQALILDEPSNELDPYASRKFSNTLRKIAQSGKSIIMVTHHLPDIIPEIGRVIMLRKGRLFRDAPKREVLTNQVLSELFNMPCEVVQRDGYYHMW